jgi:hypothetical protein
VLANSQHKKTVLFTFQSYKGLTLGGLLSDALNHRGNQFAQMAVYIAPSISGHKYMRVDTQALHPAVSTAALSIADLLNALVEFGFPSLFGHVHVFAI